VAGPPQLLQGGQITLGVDHDLGGVIRRPPLFFFFTFFFLIYNFGIFYLRILLPFHI